MSIRIPFVIPTSNTNSTKPPNRSGVTLRTDVYKRLPSWEWVDETTGYKEDYSQTDAVISRVFFVPWLERFRFAQWALGRSENNGAGGITRDPPIQHPVLTYLFASEVEMIEGVGAWIEDVITFESLRPPQQSPLEKTLVQEPREERIERNQEWRRTPFPPDAGIGELIQDDADTNRFLRKTLDTPPDQALPNQERLVNPDPTHKDPNRDQFGSGSFFRTLLPPVVPSNEWRQWLDLKVTSNQQTNPGQVEMPASGRTSVSDTLIAYVDMQEFNPADQRFLDGRAKMKVTYRSRDYEVRSDADAERARISTELVTRTPCPTELTRYVSRKWSYSISAIPLPLGKGGTVLKFSEGPAGVLGQEVKAGPPLLLPRKQITYTWHHVPDVPHAAIDACLGRTNLNKFDGVPGYELFEPDTLLMQPPEINRMRSVDGRICWEIIYKFDFNPLGWNTFPAANGRSYPATYGGGGVGADNTPYLPADYNALWRLPAPADYEGALLG